MLIISSSGLYSYMAYGGGLDIKLEKTGENIFSLNWSVKAGFQNMNPVIIEWS